MARTNSGLRQRILLALLGYVVVLSLAVIVNGLVVNEYVERMVWQTLLDSEFDHFLERRAEDPTFRWVDTEQMKLFDAGRPETVPADLRGLPPGLHDDIMVDGIERVVLIREVDGRKLMLALDLTELEAREFDMGLTVIGSALTMVVLLGGLIAWGVNRLVRPLSHMADRIARLQPDKSGQRIEVPDSASAELVVIADALNDYLQRNDRFVERERVFIDSASHELRTPIAVIAGASEIALQHEMPIATRSQLTRIRRTARDVEHLISLLLVLARDPARLALSSDRVALDQLLPEIVEDHRYLTHDKDLAITLAPMPAIEIVAPLPIVQAAVGNLLRNAIEHSDRGEIAVRLEAPATVVIDDPGHGMTPEEISAIYARVARGGGDRGGSGIGLDLISRLCEHLGWQLEIASSHGNGTTTTLRFQRKGGADALTG